MPEGLSLTAGLQKFYLNEEPAQNSNLDLTSLTQEEFDKGYKALDAELAKQREQAKKEPKEVRTLSYAHQLKFTDNSGNSVGLLRHATNQFTKGFINGVADTFETLADGMTYLGAYAIENDPQQRQDIIDNVRKRNFARVEDRKKFLDELMPNSKEYNDSFWFSDVPGGVGSMASFMVPGMYLKALKPLQGLTKLKYFDMASSSLFGAAQESKALETEAYNATGDLNKASTAKWIGGLIGLSEGIPIGHAFTRADKIVSSFAKSKGVKMAFGDLFKKLSLKEATFEGMEEFAQEFGQTVAENATAKELWDDSRSLLDGAWRGGAVGFVTGFGLQFMATGARRIAEDPKMTPEERKIAEDTFKAIIDHLQKTEVKTKEDAAGIVIASNLSKTMQGLFSQSTPETIVNTFKSQIQSQNPEMTDQKLGEIIQNKALDFENLLVSSIEETKGVGKTFLSQLFSLTKNMTESTVDEAGFKLDPIEENGNFYGFSVPSLIDKIDKLYSFTEGKISDVNKKEIFKHFDIPVTVQNELLVAKTLNVGDLGYSLIKFKHPEIDSEVLNNAIIHIKESKNESLLHLATKASSIMDRFFLGQKREMVTELHDNKTKENWDIEGEPTLTGPKVKLSDLLNKPQEVKNVVQEEGREALLSDLDQELKDLEEFNEMFLNTKTLKSELSNYDKKVAKRKASKFIEERIAINNYVKLKSELEAGPNIKLEKDIKSQIGLRINQINKSLKKQNTLSGYTALTKEIALLNETAIDSEQKKTLEDLFNRVNERIKNRPKYFSTFGEVLFEEEGNESNSNIDYKLRLIQGLEKIQRNTFDINKSQGWINDLQKQGVPKEQIELFKSVAKNGMTKGEIIASILLEQEAKLGPTIGTYNDIMTNFTGQSISDFVTYLKGKLESHPISKSLFTILDQIMPTLTAKEINIAFGKMSGIDRKHRGLYDPNSNSIVINPEATYSDPIQLLQTLVHESLHAYIRAFMNSNSEQAKAFKAELNKIYSQFIEELKAGRVNFLTIGDLSFVGKDNELDEFVSYLFANQKKLAQATSGIQVKADNWFRRFLKALADFLPVFKRLIESKDQSILDRMGELMREYDPYFKKAYLENTSEAALKMERLEKILITDNYENTGDLSYDQTANGLKNYQDDPIAGDNNEDLATMTSFIDSVANALGISLGEYYSIMKNKSYEEVVRTIEEANKAVNGGIEASIRSLYDSKYYKYYQNPKEDYLKFREAFVIGKMKRARETSLKSFVSFLTYWDKDNAKSKLIHYGSESFKDPSGKTVNAFSEDMVIEELLPGLENLLGLKPGSLKITSVNDFTRDWGEGNKQTASIKRLTNKMMGSKSKDFVTRELQNKLDKLEDSDGHRYLSIGNFGGKSSLPLIRYSKENSVNITAKFSAIVNMYNNLLVNAEVKITDPFLNKSAMFRTIIEDLWDGCLKPDGTVTSDFLLRTHILKDANSKFKRGGRLIQGITTPIEDKSILDSLEKKLGDTYETSNVRGVRLDSQTGKVMASIMIYDHRNGVIANLIAEALGLNAEEKFFINKYGIDITDGASFYIIDELDTVYRKINGSIKSGALKNAYVSGLGERPLFIKHAMHGVSRNSLLGQYMASNNIGLLVSDSSAKMGVNSSKINEVATLSPRMTEVQVEDNYIPDYYNKDEIFELPLSRFFRIKEEETIDYEGGSLKQTFYGSAFGPYNTGLKGVSGVTKIKDLLLSFEDRAAQRITDTFDKMTDDELIQAVKELALEPQGYRDKIISNIFKPIFMDSVAEIKADYGGLLNEPIIAKAIRAKLRTKIESVMSAFTIGARAGLGPSLGRADWHQQVKPVEDQVKSILITRSVGNPSFEKLVPDRKTRELIIEHRQAQREKNYLGRKEKGYEQRKKELNDILDKTRAELELIKPGYKNLIEFVQSETQEQKDIIQRELDKYIDPVTGRLNRGYALISKDLANRYNIKPGDKIITIVTPTDSMLGVSVVTVVGIMETDGPNKVSDHSKVIMNSEYVQGEIGKDFDIDTISIIPFSEHWTKEMFNDMVDIIEQGRDSYVQAMVNQYNKTFKAKGYPTGIVEVTEENLFNKDTVNLIQAHYAQCLLGKVDNYKTKYSVIGEDFFDISDKYLFDPAKVIVERREHAALSAIDFGISLNIQDEKGNWVSKEFKVNNKNWMELHLLHLIMTNHAVDAPNNTALYSYKSNLDDPNTKVNMYKLMFGIPDNLSSVPSVKVELGFGLVDAIDKTLNVIFKPAFALTGGLSNNRESLEFVDYQRQILLQKSIFKALEEKNTKYIINLVKETYKKVDDKTLGYIAGLVNSMNFKDLNNYPLFYLINKVDPLSWPTKGVTFDRYLEIDNAVVEKLITMHPILRNRFNEAKKDGNVGVKAFNDILFQWGKKDPKVKELEQLKSDAIALAKASDEDASGEGRQAQMFSASRSRVFPILLRSILSNDAIRFKMNSPEILTFTFNEYGKSSKIELIKVDKTQLQFKINNDVFTTKDVLSKEVDNENLVSLRKFLFNTSISEFKERGSTKSSIPLSAMLNRKEFKKMINLQENSDVDKRRELLEQYIKDNIYSGKFNFNHIMGFWLTSIGQLKNDQSAANFVINAQEYNEKQPANFQENVLLKELLSKFEPTLFSMYMQAWSNEVKTLAASDINKYWENRWQEFTGGNNEILFEEDDTQDTAKHIYDNALDKYIDDLQPEFFTLKGYKDFKKLLKEQGYVAGFKQLMKLADDVATRMGLAENGIYGRQLAYDFKHMSPSQFKEKYKGVDTQLLGRAINFHKMEALDKFGQYDPDLVPESDQALNNLEALYWYLSSARKPYIGTEDVKNASTLNKVLKKIRSFINISLDNEVKNYTFREETDKEIIDFVFDAKSGFRPLDFYNFKYHIKDYSERGDIALGEGSLAFAKGELLDTQIKLTKNEMTSIVKFVREITNYAGTDGKKARDKFIASQGNRIANHESLRFIYDAINNYNGDSKNSVAETRRIYDLAENLFKRDKIRVERRASDGKIVYTKYTPEYEIDSEGDIKRYQQFESKYEFINEFIPKANGQEKLRMLAALELREMYDVNTREFVSATKKYLAKLKEKMAGLHGDEAATVTINNIVKRFDSYYSAMGVSDTQAALEGTAEGKYGNYMPLSYPEHIRELIYKEREYHLAKKLMEEEITRHKKFKKEGKDFDPTIVNMTVEEMKEEANKIAQRKLLELKANMPGTAVVPHFLERDAESEYLTYAVKDDLGVHQNYIQELTHNIHSDIICAEAEIFRVQARKAGNKEWFIKTGREWFGNQVENRFLRSTSTPIEELKKGAEVSFYIYGGVVDENGRYNPDSPIAISGTFVSAKDGKLQLSGDSAFVKREALFKLSKYKDTLDKLRRTGSNSLVYVTGQYLEKFNELVNIANHDYFPVADISLIETEQDLYKKLVEAYEAVLRNPERMASYNLDKTFVIDDHSKKVTNGTHLSRYKEPGALGVAVAYAREARNAKIIDGEISSATQMSMYRMYQLSLKVIESFKQALNWLMMGASAGGAASVVNTLGAYKANRIDSPYYNWKTAKDWSKYVSGITNLPYEDLSDYDKRVIDRLQSAGLVSQDDQVDISLSSGNLDPEKLMLDEPWLKLMNELRQATKQAKDYQMYKKRIIELRERLLDAKVSNNTELMIATMRTLADAEARWKAFVEGVIKELGAPMSQKETDDLIAKMEADSKAGKLTNTNFAQKYNVTSAQAFWLIGVMSLKKAYTSQSFGVGLQRRAEQQRVAAYGIAYTRALENGFSEEAAHLQGVRSVERSHAFYDNAHRQIGATTPLGKLLFMYAQYKYSMFEKYMRMLKAAVPQWIKHKKRLKSWSDWPGVWDNIKLLFDRNIEVSQELQKGLRKADGNLSMKDVNLANFLFNRTAIGMVSAQIGATMLYGFASSDDPVTQMLYDVIELATKHWDDDDEEVVTEGLWVLQETLFFAGMPQSMAVNAAATAAFLDEEYAMNVFNKGRFKLQSEFMGRRIPGTINKVAYEMGIVNNFDVEKTDTLMDPWVFDKLVGIKVLGWSKDADDNWIDYKDRGPMLMNPFNYIPFFSVSKRID